MFNAAVTQTASAIISTQPNETVTDKLINSYQSTVVSDMSSSILLGQPPTPMGFAAHLAGSALGTLVTAPREISYQRQKQQEAYQKAQQAAKGEGSVSEEHKSYGMKPQPKPKKPSFFGPGIPEHGIEDMDLGFHELTVDDAFNGYKLKLMFSEPDTTKAQRWQEEVAPSKRSWQNPLSYFEAYDKGFIGKLAFDVKELGSNISQYEQDRLNGNHELNQFKTMVDVIIFLNLPVNQKLNLMGQMVEHVVQGVENRYNRYKDATGLERAYMFGEDMEGLAKFSASSFIGKGLLSNQPLMGTLESTASFERAAIIKGFQDHHIISPTNALTRDHELLELAGFNLESRANKIFLPTDEYLHPTRTIHLGRHTTVAIRQVQLEMNQVVKIGQAQGWSQTEYQEALRSMLQDFRQQLKAGDIALNKNMRPWANRPGF